MLQNYPNLSLIVKKIKRYGIPTYEYYVELSFCECFDRTNAKYQAISKIFYNFYPVLQIYP